MTDYTRAEDEAIISAWCAITSDPVVGVNQPERDFWTRIEAEYRAQWRGDTRRTKKSLQTRVGTLKKDVKKFVGHVRDIFRQHPSGSNPEKNYWDGEALYEESGDKRRRWKHQKVFEILIMHFPQEYDPSILDPQTTNMASQQSQPMSGMEDSDDMRQDTPNTQGESSEYGRRNAFYPDNESPRGYNGRDLSKNRKAAEKKAMEQMTKTLDYFKTRDEQKLRCEEQRLEWEKKQAEDRHNFLRNDDGGPSIRELAATNALLLENKQLEINVKIMSIDLEKIADAGQREYIAGLKNDIMRRQGSERRYA